MRKFKTIIVDDEKHGRENLRSILTNYCPQIELAGEASSVTEARELISKHEPEVVFLDILMPVLNGFDLLDQFQERKFVVIFVSASIEFGIQAVKAGVLDYVLKPINITEIQSAITKVESHYERHSNEVFTPGSAYTKIALAHSNGFSMEEIENITHLQADDNYTKVFTVSGKCYLISRPLKDFERSLVNGLFVRTHKSFMINIKYLKDFTTIDGGVITLNDGVKIPVSKRKNSVFKEAIRKLSLVLHT